MTHDCDHESTWLERSSFENAEHDFQTHQAKKARGQNSNYQLFDPHHSHSSQHHSPQKGYKSISGQIAKAREHIRATLNGVDSASTPSCDAINNKVVALEKQVVTLTSRLEALEKFCKLSCSPTTCLPTTTPCATTTTKEKEEEEDFELFGSDEEEPDEAAEKLKEQRIAAYQAKKQTKPTLIAKSNVIFDVKPWDDETDMVELEKQVRSVHMDGLFWGASKLVPLAYGIRKLQITCVIEDEKVSTEEMEERITAFEDYIQSVDIAAFNKI